MSPRRKEPPGLAPLVAIYRVLLVLLPESWEEPDRDELVGFFRARYRDAWASGGLAGAGASALRAFSDAVRTAVAERRDARRGAGVSGETESGGMGMREAMMGGLSDLRLAVRSLRRSWSFTAVCVITLALGVGPTTALFTVLRSLVLAPLPYPEAERLVSIRRDLVQRGIPNYPAAPADVVEYRAGSDAFSAIAAYIGTSPIVDEDGRSERVSGLMATPEIFDVLGVRPALGRPFTPEEGIEIATDEEDPQPFPVILSHGYWQRGFGGDPQVIGRTLSFGAATATVVGVMPEGFQLLVAPEDGAPVQPDVMMPFTIDPTDPWRGSFFLRTVGRLAPGVSFETAVVQMAVVSADQRERYANAKAAGTTVRLVPLQEDVSADVRPLLLSLGAALAFVLLIACVNVSNLLLVRASGRGRELSVRTALGGGRLRLIRQLFMEAVVLAVLGGTTGVVLAWAGLPLLARTIPPELPRLGPLELSLPVLFFALGATLSAALLFGTLPALRGSRADVMDALRERAGMAASGHRMRSALVVLEVALSFVLVFGAGLMTRSFVALHGVDPGFRAERVLTFQTALPPGAYQGSDALSGVLDALRGELTAIPGVDAVGVTSSLPLGGGEAAAPYGGEAELADGDESDLRQANIHFVGEGYFEALGTPLLAGRELTRADAADSVVKVLVDRALAERTWPGESAIGKRIYVKVAVPGVWFEVAGVVGHQRYDGLTGVSRESIYFPPLAPVLGGGFPSEWVLRSTGDPSALVAPARAAVARVDDRILIENVEPLTERVARARAPTGLVSMFVGSFGLLALALALVGLYGVMAYIVRERSGEFGLRIALGADREGILGMVMRRGIALTGLGVAIGIVGALSLRSLLAAVSNTIPSTDALTLAGVTVLFFAMASAASLVPARRAVRVDPAVTLREE